MKKNKYKKISNGFTLIEITVALSIFIVMMIIGMDYILKGFRSSTFIYEQAVAVQNARRATDIIVKEIRKANRAETGDYLLDTVLPQTFIFYSDVNSDDATEKVRYFLDNQELKRGVISATGTPIQYPSDKETVSPLTNYINNNTVPIFTYFDKNNQQISNPTANKQNIRLINISAKINVTPTKAPMDFYIQANVQIRNLKDNL